MQSHWDKLPSLRVVDAGYLLAKIEPEPKWQFAPPLVKNFFNVIREQTGAVTLATLPGERSVITQAEFQALKAAYGVSPATQANSPANSDPLVSMVQPVAERGHVLTLPTGQAHVQFGELAHLIADALWPDTGPDDDRMTYACTRLELDAELARAVASKALPLKNPLTLGPHTFPVGNALKTSVVTVGDLREFLAGRLDIVTNEPTATPAPEFDSDLTDTVKHSQVKHRTWRDVAWPYVVETFKASQYSTAKDFYRALENKAGANGSPFDKGTGVNLHSLYVREISETVMLKTIQNAWPEIKASR